MTLVNAVEYLAREYPEDWSEKKIARNKLLLLQIARQQHLRSYEYHGRQVELIDAEMERLEEVLGNEELRRG